MANRAQNGEVSVEARRAPFVLVAVSCNAVCLISVQCEEYHADPLVYESCLKSLSYHRLMIFCSWIIRFLKHSAAQEQGSRDTCY